MNISNKTLTMGGRTFDAAERAIGVWLYGPVVTASRYTTLREYSNSAGYVVPANKELRMWACRLTSTAGTVLVGAVPGYGDNDVTVDSAAAPTNAVWLPSGASLNSFFGNVNTGGNYAQNEFAFYMPVAAGKYPCIRLSQGNSNAIIFATLHDV